MSPRAAVTVLATLTVRTARGGWGGRRPGRAVEADGHVADHDGTFIPIDSWKTQTYVVTPASADRTARSTAALRWR